MLKSQLKQPTSEVRGGPLWPQSSKKNKDNALQAIRGDMSVSPLALFWGGSVTGAYWKPEDDDDTFAEKAARLQSVIKETMCRELDIDEEEDADKLEALNIDKTPIQNAFQRCFFDISRYDFICINDDGSYVVLKEKDVPRFLKDRFGDIANTEFIKSRVISIQPPKTSRDKTQREVRRITRMPWDEFFTELKSTAQASRSMWREDMFASKPGVRVKQNSVHITIPHTGFKKTTEPDPSIIEDFKEHFPECVDVLNMFAAARFSRDRKKAFLWLRADSDWGKGFFTSCLADLGLVVELSVTEIQKMFQGSPVAKTPRDFIRSWVLVVNEFNSIKLEIKQLEHTLELAPKHQLASKVPVFAKLFTSADNVPDMATDHGVEEQFSRRFSFIRKTGTLNERDLFRENTTSYRSSVTSWMAEHLNHQVALYRSMGRDLADREATKYLNDFHRRHSISQELSDLKDSFEAISDEFRTWLLTERFHSPFLIQDTAKKRLFLKNPAKMLHDFLIESKAPEEIPHLKNKKTEIFKNLSADGTGVKSYRINGKPTTSVLIQDGS
ncbi:hypothetical protein [Halorhodospira sp. 9622]|uniref:hypothetical protein n=1 Tax=Halorhodospira sp. 9622 TaxID=2899136 RepID=UPI001EE7C29F|nr:hypothetical protein [Halorhodospira sp. 9622]MCG5539278.1 hypothetical protein [Halorhodospira sp. 9622]